MRYINDFKGLSGAVCLIAAGIIIGGTAEQVMAQFKGPTDMRGVSVTELGIINEESLKAQLGIEGFILRMRAVTLQPGGHIMEHSHANSPGLVKMVSGVWIEGFPDGREVSYNALDSMALKEEKDTVHWVYNRGEVPATGVVCGIQPAR